MRHDRRAGTVEEVLHRHVQEFAGGRGEHHDDRGAVPRLQHEEPGHGDDDQPEDGRAADRRQIDQRFLDPGGTHRPRRIDRIPQRAQDPGIEGLRVTFGHCAGERQEPQKQQAQAEAREEPDELAALAARPPATCHMSE